MCRIAAAESSLASLQPSPTLLETEGHNDGSCILCRQTGGPTDRIKKVVVSFRMPCPALVLDGAHMYCSAKSADLHTSWQGSAASPRTRMSCATKHALLEGRSRVIHVRKRHLDKLRQRHTASQTVGCQLAQAIAIGLSNGMDLACLQDLFNCDRTSAAVYGEPLKFAMICHLLG